MRKQGVYKMKKLLLMIMIIMITLASFTNVYAHNFPDIIKDTNLDDAVGLLSNYSIVQGYPDGTYKPDKQVTRAEI